MECYHNVQCSWKSLDHLGIHSGLRGGNFTSIQNEKKIAFLKHFVLYSSLSSLRKGQQARIYPLIKTAKAASFKPN
jgi:hypothetical protein